MISVVSVYNNEAILASHLVESLRNQTERYELIAVDNRDGRFRSAAAALNWGATRASGDWVAFVHQDIVFLSDHWLARAERLLRGSPYAGWWGVLGNSPSGDLHGMMRDRGMLLGTPFRNPKPVLTLDECLLIHARVAGKDYFDEQVPGWHAYGVEACCQAIREGRSNFVLPLPIWHDSTASNRQGLAEAQAYVVRKHGDVLGTIYNPSYRSAESDRPPIWARLRRRLWGIVLSLTGFDATCSHWFSETLESLTLQAPRIDCLHAAIDQPPIVTAGFAFEPIQPRLVVHHFAGFAPSAVQSACVVLAPDLAADLPDTPDLLEYFATNVAQLLVCVDHPGLDPLPRWWRPAYRRARRLLTLQWNKPWTLILDLRR